MDALNKYKLHSEQKYSLRFSNLFKIAIFILFIFSFISSCNKPPKVPAIKVLGKNKEVLMRINKHLVSSDSAQIDSYTKREKLDMNITETGLWYKIIYPGKKRKARKDDIVTVIYSAKLLDGTVCITADSLKPKTLNIGHSENESGLSEGLKLIGEGGKIIIIAPPHLAYGLTGDGNLIPARSVIVYDVFLRKIN